MVEKTVLILLFTTPRKTLKNDLKDIWMITAVGNRAIVSIFLNTEFLLKTQCLSSLIISLRAVYLAFLPQYKLTIFTVPPVANIKHCKSWSLNKTTNPSKHCFLHCKWWQRLASFYHSRVNFTLFMSLSLLCTLDLQVYVDALLWGKFIGSLNLEPTLHSQPTIFLLQNILLRNLTYTFQYCFTL